MSKDQFISQADSICASTVARQKPVERAVTRDLKRYKKKLRKLRTSLNRYFTKTLALANGELSALKAIGEPDVDQDLLAKYFATYETGIQTLADIKKTLKNGGDADQAFSEIKKIVAQSEAEATAFGFKTCS